jgi:hypothetical protein
MSLILSPSLPSKFSLSSGICPLGCFSNLHRGRNSLLLIKPFPLYFFFKIPLYGSFFVADVATRPRYSHLPFLGQFRTPEILHLYSIQPNPPSSCVTSFSKLIPNSLAFPNSSPPYTSVLLCPCITSFSIWGSQ